jgi:prepilin-type processing-associated H-X9-DG protein
MQNYMNAWSGDTLSNTYRLFLKYSYITQPAQFFVFLDEKPSSIDDGLFEEELPASGVIQGSSITQNNWPSQAHNNACGFGFSDGHAEIHQWKGPLFTEAIDPGAIPIPPGDPNYNDALWIALHTTSAFAPQTTAH